MWVPFLDVFAQLYAVSGLHSSIIIIVIIISFCSLVKVATKTADRSLLPPAPAPGVLAPGAWISLTRGGRSFKGMVTAVKEKELEVRFKTSISAKCWLFGLLSRLHICEIYLTSCVIYCDS